VRARELHPDQRLQPPVLTITAQVGLSWAAGSPGLLVAVPLVAVVMVAVQMLYVEDTLRDRLESDVEASARQEVEKDAEGRPSRSAVARLMA